MSYQSTTGRQTTSCSRVSRLSRRLKSGAIAMSRSAITHTELLGDKIVDVGEGVVANVFEQLLARLEQHGLRRCFADDSEDDEPGIDHDSNVSPSSRPHPHQVLPSEDLSVNVSLRPSSDEQGDNGLLRKPYYYMCVPCELRLTEISTSPATLTMLQDAHYHCASAEHRRIASWMGEPDIDCTLQNSPDVDPAGYAQIHVNGVPMLISSRPGGGDMFFPLPHEAQDRMRTAPSGMDGILLSTQPKTEVWHNPLRSIYTGAKQFLCSVDVSRQLRTAKGSLLQSRSHFMMQHIPMDVYEKESFVGSGTVPALFKISRQRLPKKRLREPESDGFRVEYVVSDKPCMVWGKNMETDWSQLVVRHNDIYRVSLMHASDVEKGMTQESPSPGGAGESTQEGTGWGNHSQLLTMEALSQVPVAPMVNRILSGLNMSEVDSCDVFTHSEIPSDVSS